MRRRAGAPSAPPAPALSVVLLGPTPPGDLLRDVLGDVAPGGSVATIRAGWQEMEPEAESLAEVLDAGAVPLDLHARAERVWREDPELMAAHQAMQAGARLLRSAYNIRLSAAMDALGALERQADPDGLLVPEHAAALEVIRELDAHQLRRIAGLRTEFADAMRLADRPVLARERAEIAKLLDGVEAVVVDGGHVAVLLNRIRLLGVEPLLVGRTIVGISGGAMVLTDRLVLFHDSPPWGPGHAEVAEAGLGLAPGVVTLPNARSRLRLDDAARVARLARRFAPAECLTLEPGSRLDFDGASWSARAAQRLTADGEVVGREAAA